MLSDRRLLRPEPSFGFGSKFWSVNWLYVVLLCALAGVGYVAQYSAGGGPKAYANDHIIRFCGSLVMMLAIAMIDIRWIEKLAWPLYFVALGLLGAVLRFGHVGKGAERWINLAGIQWQPSELMKIALVVALASWFRKADRDQLGHPLFLLPPVLAILVPMGLILKEPNLGTAFITGVLGVTVFIAAGVRLWILGGGLAAVAAALPVAYHHLHDYQRARITTFLHPESDPLGAGYNIIQSKIALGSGGMWGKGFMQGTQGHLNFLPEKQTDFIFTIIGEEFGMMGSFAVLALLAVIVGGAFAMALRIRHQFGRLLGVGLATNIFMYVFVNLAMVMGVIPVGGVPLPLVSHGGSAMITVMFGFGLLMSAWVHRDVVFDEGER
jgi:rod shape determining protein RodA